MRIGIHQPNFLPWMGYFYKIAQCNNFVFLDHVEYTKKSYTKRVKIHKSADFCDEQYITVHLQKHSDHASINALKIVDDTKWQKKIAAQIHQIYSKAPYYYQLESLIDRFFSKPIGLDSFSAFNIEIIKYISELLELKAEWITSSDLAIDYSEGGVNLDIISHLNGNAYISGMGAKKYQDESLFAKSNIQLIYSDFPKDFKKLGIPEHFMNKSIVSYLAHYDLEYLITIAKTE